jgi:glucokinase
MLLAGDIGGTKTLLALFHSEKGPRRPLAEAEFRSAEFPNLEALVHKFLGQIKQEATYGCFDVAGPVIGGRAQLTNLPWALSEDSLATNLGLKKVAVINDLRAVAYAVPHLQAEDIHTINPGKAAARGAMAVAAPGTGLGEAFLIRSGTGYLACSSEGGHADFSPANELQGELWRYLHQKFGHVSYERVCSGQGLPNIYTFLRDCGYAAEPPGFAAELTAAADPTPLIVRAALQDPAANPLGAATLQMFVEILGAEAGNLALKVLATGGVYLGGGIPKRILPWLEDGRFMQAFANKGRFTDLMHKIPVHVITSQAALLGAALYGFDHFTLA